MKSTVYTEFMSDWIQPWYVQVFYIPLLDADRLRVSIYFNRH